MTHEHSATAAYDHELHGVAITVNADTAAEALGQDERLDRLADAIEEAEFRHSDARLAPAGPVRDFARQEAIDAFAAQLGDVSLRLSTTDSLHLVVQLLQAVRQDPRLAAHPYLIELADCSVRRLLGAHQLLSGAPGLIDIPAVPA